LLTLIGALPVGVDGLLRRALGPRAERRTLVPAVIVIFASLALAPAVGWLFELTVRSASVAEFVDRTLPSEDVPVAVDGYALLVSLDAPPPADATTGGGPRVYRWYVIRDATSDQRLALVRTPLAIKALQLREITARVVDDHAAVAGALAAITASGRAVPSDPINPVLLEEVLDPRGTVRQLDSTAGLAGAAPGELVRIRLRMSGTAVATCAVGGDCAARRLAAGVGTWDNLASNGDGTGWVVLRTAYPPSEGRFTGVGGQVRDQQATAQLLGRPWVQRLLGGAYVLSVIHLDQAINLPVDRLWLAPLLFALAATLLLIGRRIGYPRFVATDASRFRRATARAAPPGAALTGLASGRLVAREATLVELDREPAALQVGDDGRAVTLALPRLGIAVQLVERTLNAIEVGIVHRVTGSRPGLRVGWFGSEVLLVFAEAADRDAAAELVRALS